MAPTVQIKRTKHITIPDHIHGSRRVKVGFPAGTGTDIVDRAIWNHYGTERGIPARPFMLNAMRKNRRKYLAAMRSSASAILTGEMTLNTFMRKLGILVQGDIQMEITNMRSPPNAASTIKAKGSSNPLIDTGEMRQKVTWVLE